MAALVPIAGGVQAVARAAPALRVIQGGLAAAGAGAAGAGAGAGGAVAVGSVLPLVAAVGAGLALGVGLRALFDTLNRSQSYTVPTFDPNLRESWPQSEPAGQIAFLFEVYQYEWNHVYGYSWQPTGFGRWGYGAPVLTQPENGNPARLNMPGDPRDEPNPSQEVTFGQNPIRLRWLQTYVVPGAVQAPPAPIPDPNAAPPPSRQPLIDALNRARQSVGMDTSVPLAFIPPAQPVIPAAPSRAPVVVPAPVIAPAPALRPAIPAGAPGPAPSPGALPTITPAPGQAPATQPQPSTFPQIDPLRPPLPIGPAGDPVAPSQPLVPVTPPDLVQYPNLTVGEPGARPRPDLDSIAKELGRQEQKLAGLLGGLGYPEAFDQLLNLLKSFNAGTTYTLHPPCGTDASGDPLPPVEVIVPATIGDNAAVIARLDAIAMLLDEHKAMRQPICKGKPVGRPVTVTFVEADP